MIHVLLESFLPEINQYLVIYTFSIAIFNLELQIRGPGFDFWRYQIFWEVACLERSPLSLVSTTEELLGRNSSGSGLENQEYDPGAHCDDHATPTIRKSWH
jgi:hypothetical protein